MSKLTFKSVWCGAAWRTSSASTIFKWSSSSGLTQWGVYRLERTEFLETTKNLSTLKMLLQMTPRINRHRRSVEIEVVPCTDYLFKVIASEDWKVWQSDQKLLFICESGHSLFERGWGRISRCSPRLSASNSSTRQSLSSLQLSKKEDRARRMKLRYAYNILQPYLVHFENSISH